MNCADVLSLARAAPEPASSSRVSTHEEGNTFDQFLQAVTVDRPTRKEEPGSTRSSNQKDSEDDPKSTSTGQVEPRQVNEKPVAKSESQEPTDVEENVKEIIAAAVAAQVLNVITPVQLPEDKAPKTAVAESVMPAAAVPVQPNIQAAVIQLPETEPQPLPDVLKQAVQQPKVEVKDFQTLVEAAAKNLENQSAQASEVAAAPNTVVETAGIKDLDVQEPAVKVVDLKAQPEDLAAIETSRNTGGLYALAAVKSENLIQPRTLPMIREISQEVANLVREQGQSMRIQVHPENMGKIDLRLISNSDGMRVVMTAEVPATAKLLETHLDQLNRSLTEAGLTVSGMSVNSQGAQGQTNNQSFNQANPGLIKITRPGLIEEPAAQSLVPIQMSASGLDYRV
jgi:flagellar hook-length control protein FliK